MEFRPGERQERSEKRGRRKRESPRGSRRDFDRSEDGDEKLLLGRGREERVEIKDEETAHILILEEEERRDPQKIQVINHKHTTRSSGQHEEKNGSTKIMQE